MERLTDKTEYCDVSECHICAGRCFEKVVYEKLRDYEDKEESGLLQQLPIALGASCYVIETCKCGSHWNKCNPDNIRLKKAKAAKPYKTYGSMRYCFKVYERPFKLIYLGYYGKKVFATFEEAEAAMQNMEIREHYRHNL